MIQANELRYNNAVYKKYRQGFFLVKEITANWLRVAEPETGHLYAESYETIAPIPLTPEILEACGFEHKGGWMAGYFTTTIYDEQVEIVFEFMDNFLLVYANDQRVRKIDSPSLHTLMNLWHSMTGTELTINLEKVKA